MFLEPTQESGRLFVERGIAGPVTMLNLLRFRAVADYRSFPALAPAADISGREAYGRYVEHTLPYLEAAGGRLLFTGTGGRYLIGPLDERWDMVMLVEHASMADFLAMAENEAYISGIGHREAALVDSRLLPLE